ncbi:hypothetical protein L484_000002 [Morus notabilis]|uniref:Uncharacterized protein n=1 Tax=Morus notabilis TaxID=981085 RepID=W9SMV7_9ROSA|nr:hypothetical protein L484_007619 [Morus notabilis]EXC60639.1 hypothetical protein L484_000002 [Morus notabilis]
MKLFRFLLLFWILIIVLLFNPPSDDRFGRLLIIGCSAGRADPGSSLRAAGPPPPQRDAGKIPHR